MAAEENGSGGKTPEDVESGATSFARDRRYWQGLDESRSTRDVDESSTGQDVGDSLELDFQQPQGTKQAYCVQFASGRALHPCWVWAVGCTRVLLGLAQRLAGCQKKRHLWRGLDCSKVQQGFGRVLQCPCSL